MARFQRGHKKTGGRKKGARNRARTSIREAIREFVANNGDQVQRALARGLAARPPHSKAYLELALRYGAGEPVGEFDATHDGQAHGLQIILSRPIGTDPLAIDYGRPSDAEGSHASPPKPADRSVKRHSALVRAAQVVQQTPKSVEVDGDEFDVS